MYVCTVGAVFTSVTCAFVNIHKQATERSYELDRLTRSQTGTWTVHHLSRIVCGLGTEKKFCWTLLSKHGLESKIKNMKMKTSLCEYATPCICWYALMVYAIMSIRCFRTFVCVILERDEGRFEDSFRRLEAYPYIASTNTSWLLTQVGKQEHQQRHS